MKRAVLTALMLATLSTPLAVAPAAAQNRDRDYRWHGDDRDWDAARDYRRSNARERRLAREDQVYRGRDGRTYCRRNDGTTGLVVGGVGGAVVGNLIGGGLLGTLAGGAGGALLGRSIDKGKVRCR